MLDTWFMSGMAATGSNDIVAEDLFVPEAYAFAVSEVRTGRGNGSRIHDNPLYAAPMLPQLCVTAALPSVGAARAAVELARQRLTVHTKMGGQSTQVDKPAAQMRLARADLMVRSAELSIRQAANENLTLSALSDEEQLPHRLRLRAQIAYAVSQCLEAVRTCCEASGSGIYALDHPLQRILRDIEVMASHIVYDMDVSTELHGRSMVGLAPNSLLT
ncbi:p-hydroxyphenylacetate 3-hydroxylase, oxygenase component [compost metagenome]